MKVCEICEADVDTDSYAEHIAAHAAEGWVDLPEKVPVTPQHLVRMHRRLIRNLVREIRSAQFEREEQRQYRESAGDFIDKIESMLREEESQWMPTGR